jgi:hypothetical protein
MSEDRVVIEYRRHAIVARRKSGSWEARALDQRKPVTEIYTATDRDAAIELVKLELDGRAAEEHAARGIDGFPTSDHVAKALRRVKITDDQAEMLKSHLSAENHTRTATELALAAGKKSYEYANSQYGKLARNVAEEMEFTPTEQSTDGSPVWTFALATGERDLTSKRPDDYVEWRWTLRPSVVEALRTLGF